MRVAVFGASSPLGREIVEQALGHGHDVVAVVGSSGLAKTHPRLREVHADVLDFDAIAPLIADRDAAVFVPPESGRGDVRSRGAANIIHAMAVAGVGKLVVVSSAGVFARSDARMPMSMRLRAATTQRARYEDLERMEQRLMASDLDWTVIRPATMTDGPFTSAYRFSQDGSLLAKAAPVSRADVAAAVLKGLETSLWDRRAVVVAM